MFLKINPSHNELSQLQVAAATSFLAILVPICYRPLARIMALRIVTQAQTGSQWDSGVMMRKPHEGPSLHYWGSSQADLTPVILIMETVYLYFSIICQHWDGTHWNLCSWRTRICLSCTFKIMTTDMVWWSQNISSHGNDIFLTGMFQNRIW